MNTKRFASILRAAGMMALAAVCGCAAAPAHRSFEDVPCAKESELPRLEPLILKIGGSRVYGQVLVPSEQIKGPHPCAIFCHGFAGFTRWDDVAQDLCRAGIAVVTFNHRGAWGSEGEYTVSGCVEDAESLAKWAMDAEFAGQYKTDTNAVFLVGHSMGGNSALNASRNIKNLKGVALLAPCDIGYLAKEKNDRQEMWSFLVREGLHVLTRRSDKAVVEDIFEKADEMLFEKSVKTLSGKRVFLATGAYDRTVPAIPIAGLWADLPSDVKLRTRKSYKTGHSFMGQRRDLARDLADFILADDPPPAKESE